MKMRYGEVASARTIVVNRGYDWYGLPSNIYTGEDCRGLRDSRKSLVNDFRRKMTELKIYMIFFRPSTTAFMDFYGHTARHNISRRKILGGWRITLHKSFSFPVE